MVEILDDLEAGRSGGRRGFTHRARRVADLAYIGRAKFETKRRVDTYGIKKPAADEFDACDERLRGLDVLLNQGNAIDRRFECLNVDVCFKGLYAVDKVYAQAFARATVLGDERSVHFLRSQERRVGKECRSKCRSRGER